MIILAMTLALSGAPKSDAPQKPESPLFQRLKKLQGTWEAKIEQMTSTVTYTLVSGGRCVKEHMDMHGGPGMDTVYCDNGDSVVATHYCDSGNQPRLKAA